MDLVKRNVTLKIETKNYGTVTIYLNDDENKVGDGYFVTARKNKKHLSGFVDYKGNEIIPLDEMELEEYFCTHDMRNLCFGFKFKDSKFLKYYQVQKNKNGLYYVKMSTNQYDNYPIVVRQIKEADDIWVFDVETENGILSCMYSPYEVKMLTPFFNELSFEVEDNPYGHFAYFCDYVCSEREYLDINDKTQSETIQHTTICGFLDKNGNFSSQLLETEGELFYDSYLLDNTPISSNYAKFRQEVLIKYEDQYDRKNKRVENILTYLFNDFNQSIPPTNKKGNHKTRILEFKSEPKS